MITITLIFLVMAAIIFSMPKVSICQAKPVNDPVHWFFTINQ
jgi:hypothetical protein